MRRFTILSPSEFLEEHAKELGVVERDRNRQIPAFVWAFVFGFRRSYNSTVDESITPGGFYHRLTPSLAEYYYDLVEATLDEGTVDADVDRFRDVMIADGTVLRLYEFLSEEYEAGKKTRLERSSTCPTMLPSRR